jgi:hypothetical protein
MDKNSVSPDIDFQQAVETQNSSFDSFLKNQEDALKYKLESKPSPASNQLWLLVSILMLSVIGLGVFTLYQKQNTEKQIAALKNQQVAGVSENDSKVIIGADGFSLVLKNNAPESFKIDRRTVPFEFIPNKIASATRFVARINRDNRELISGIEVVVSEYDNKLTIDDFNKTVVQKLGSGWVVQETNITLPKDIKLTKYTNPNVQTDEIYTALTADNYYLIKVYNQTTRYPDLAEISRFSDSILDYLYLN